MSDFLLYTLGLRDALELDEMVRQFLNEETVETLPPSARIPTMISSAPRSVL